jgi:8-oxo-dGTP diphosphatase
MEIQETLEAAALRELKEETGLEIPALTQVHTFSALDRDPRGRVVSTCFAAILQDSDQIDIQAGSDAAEAGWFSLNELPELAFDHQQVIRRVVEKFLSPQQDR